MTPSTPRQQLVLCIDDAEVALRVRELLLAGAGYAVLTASSGEEGLELFSYVSTSGSYLSASDKKAHFGLGSSKKARLVEISWPSGVVQRLESVAADQIVTLHEKSG